MKPSLAISKSVPVRQIFVLNRLFSDIIFVVCFKLTADPSIQDGLGDEIQILKNGIWPVGTALNANELSNEACINDVQENDVFKFVTAGDDNVRFPERSVSLWKYSQVYR